VIDALVVGATLPAFQAALDLAEVGLRVRVVMPPGAADAEPVAIAEPDHEGSLAALLARIARPIEGTDAPADTRAVPRELSPTAPAMRADDAGWVRHSQPELFGVPSVPLAAESIRLLGTGGAFRAYLDRVTPLLTLGKTRMFGTLVRKRMGRAALRAAQTPVLERFGVDAEQVEVALVAPGLNEALTRAGALSSAVLAYSERHAGRETRLQPVGDQQNWRLSALDKLVLYGVEVTTSQVGDLSEHEDYWSVLTGHGERIDARSLVLDQGDEVASMQHFAPVLGDVLPASKRFYAEAVIDRPSWLPEQHVALHHAGHFSARIDAAISADPERAVLQLRSRRVLLAGTDQQDRLPGETGANPTPGTEFAEGRGDMVSEARPVLNELGLEIGPHELQFRQRAAPFVSIAERDAARARLDAVLSSRPTLLPVGRALHGDDLSAALKHAGDQAIRLRRLLLGLEADSTD